MCLFAVFIVQPKNFVSADILESEVKITPQEFSFGQIDRNDKKVFKVTAENISERSLNLTLSSPNSEIIIINSNWYFIIDPKQKVEAKFTLNPISLPAGNYKYEITFSINASIKGTIPVTFYIKPTPPKLFVDQEVMDFGVVYEQTSNPKILQIKNGGEETLKGTIKVDSPWINVSDRTLLIESDSTKSVQVTAEKTGDIKGFIGGKIFIETSGGTKTISVKVDFKTRTIVTLFVGQKIAYRNNDQLYLDVPPIIQNGRTLVPIRFISEAFGANVNWDSRNSTVRIFLKEPETNISLQINNRIAIVNNKSIVLDVPPIIKNGRTMVPIRFISEAFGANVDWSDEKRQITIVLIY
jgi:aromatic ring-cleaving dioxygenase